MSMELQPLATVGGERPKTKVFISYSRKDMAFVDRLAGGLEGKSVQATIDRTEIYAFEDWWRRIANLIAAADTVIFVLSPDAIASDICRKEVNRALELNKRMAPIVCRPISGEMDKIPPSLTHLNFVFFDGDSPFEQALDKLVDALETDIDWIRHHTQYGLEAIEWVKSSRAAGLLLRSPRLEEAEHWIATRPSRAPSPSEDTRSLIRESRRGSIRRRNILTGSLVAGLVIALGLGAIALSQRDQAVEQRRIATEQRDAADAASRDAERQRDYARAAEQRAKIAAVEAKANAQQAKDELRAAQRSESLTLAEQSLRETQEGRVRSAREHALAALPNDDAAPNRPYLRKAAFALSKAVLSTRLLHALTPGRDQVNTGVFSPDGRLFATGSRDGVMSVWDVASGRLVRSCQDQRGAVLAVTFDPKGRSVASYHQYPTSLIVRDAVSGAIQWDFELPQSSPGQLVYTPDGSKIIATAQQGDSRPRLFDLSAAGRVTVLDNLGAGIFDSVGRVTIIERNRALAFYRNIGFIIWDLTTGRIVATSNAASGGKQSADFLSQLKKLDANEEIQQIQTAKSGQEVFVQGKTSIFEFDSNTLQLISQVKYRKEWIVPSPNVFYVFADGSRAIVGVSLDLFELVDLKSAHVIASFSGKFAYGTQWAVSPDGRLFAAQSVDTNIHIWKIDTGVEETLLHESSTQPQGLGFAPDSSKLAAWSTPTAFIWDIRPDVIRLAAPGGGWALDAVDSQGRFALTHKSGASREGAIWDLPTHRLVAHLDVNACNEDELRDSAFSPVGDKLLLRCKSSGEGGRLQLRLLASPTGDPLDVIALKDGTVTTRWSEDSHLIAINREMYDSSNPKSSVQIWDVVSKKESLSFTQKGTDPSVYFTSPTEIVATTKSENRLIASLWDVPSKSQLGEAERQGEDALVVPARRILIGGTNTKPDLIELPSNKNLGSVFGQATVANAILVSRDGEYLLLQRTGSPATLWRTKGPQLLAYLPSRTEAGYSAFTDNGTRIITRQWRKTAPRLLIYETKTARLLKVIEGTTPYLDAFGGEMGKRVVAQTALRSIEIHDVEGDRPKRSLDLAGRLYRWRMLDHDERLVTADQSGVVTIWDAASGQKLRELSDAAGGDPLSNSDSNGSRIAMLTALGGVRVLNVNTGETLMELDLAHGSARRAALSPDGKSLALEQSAGIEICLISKKTCSASIPTGGAGLNSLNFSPSGNSILAEEKGGATLLVDVVQGRIAQTFLGPSKVRFDFTKSPCFAIASGKMLYVFDADKRAILNSSEYANPIYDAFVSASCREVGITTIGGDVFNLDVSKAQKSLVTSLPAIPHGLSYAPSGMIVFEGDPFWDTGRVSLRELSAGGKVAFFDRDWPSQSFGTWWTSHTDPTGKYLGVLTPDDELIISRTRDLSMASRMMWGGRSLVDFCFSLNGETAVIVTRGGDIGFWNSERGGAQATLANLGNFSQFPRQTLSLAPDGSHVLAVDSSGNVVLLSLLTHSARIFASGNSEPQSRAALSPDGTLLATLSPSGLLRIWDVAIGQPLLEVPLEPTYNNITPEISFSADGLRVIAKARYMATAVIELSFDRASLEAEDHGQSSTVQPAAVGGTRYRLGMVSGFKAQAPPATSKGIYVLDVIQDTPAMEAGIRFGDEIIAVNGEHPVQPRDVTQLVAKAGSNVVLDLRRAGRPLQIMVRLN